MYEAEKLFKGKVVSGIASFVPNTELLRGNARENQAEVRNFVQQPF